MQSLGTPPATPHDLFVVTLDGALEVDAPLVRLGIEVEGLEGDLDLERPAVWADKRPDVPDAVPGPTTTTTAETAAAATTTREQSVAEYAGRIGFEEIPRPSVLERVQDPHETIVCAQVAVALFLVREDTLGIVIHDGADVEPVGVVRDPYLRITGGRSSFNGLCLREVPDRHSL